MTESKSTNNENQKQQPAILEPGGVYPMQLDEVPGAATFFVRHLSLRDQFPIMAAVDVWLDDKTSNKAAYDQTVNALRAALVNWENARNITTGELVPFAFENLDLVCDLWDVRRLLFKIIRNGRPAPQEKKESSSPR